jgi:hypothetical protein
MSTFPGTTGQVVTSAMWNGLPAFEVQTAKTADYTAGSGDEYQQLIPMNKATAIAFQIPTDATYDFAIGTVITVLNIGVGLLTIDAVTSGTTTVLSAGATAASPTVAQYKSAACIKTAANAWYVVGAIA